MISPFKRSLLALCLGSTAWFAHADQTQEILAQLNPEQAKVVDAFSTLPMIRSVALSDNGQKMALLRATTKNGDYIVEVRNTNDLAAKPVRLGASKMLISSVNWLNDDTLLISFRQILKSGAKKRWVNQVALVNADGTGDWLIPYPKQSFSILDRLKNSPNELLIQVDVNNNYIPDVVRYNIKNSRKKTLIRGNSKISGGFTTDLEGEVRLASGFDRSTDSINYYAKVKGDDEWTLLKTISPNLREDFDILGFSKENPNHIYVKANNGKDKAAIHLYDIKSKRFVEELFGLGNVDAESIITDPQDNLVGFGYINKHPERYFIDAKAEALDQGIKQLFPKQYVRVVDRTEDNNRILVQASSGKNPGSYYLIEDKSKLKKIGDRMPSLQEVPLSAVKYISYQARDGRKIYTYVTIPTVGKKPYPTVILPHGGPWVRDTIVFDEWAQLLASQGYMVVQPNYRGSTGYGLDHWKAGDKKWGLSMQDDLDDAALMLVNKGLADKDRLAMFGWSYGGYAAFAASTRQDNIYQCAVAGAGVSNLSRINATLNDNPYLSRLQRPTIAGVSPVEKVKDVSIPILVVHGDMDIRVPVKHSREFVEGLEKYNKTHDYLELKEADHFGDTLFYEHKQQFYGRLLSWLDKDCGLMTPTQKL